MSAPRKPILIAGPTASGKSAQALALAERLNGVVINADSMQVYRELRVLTARPSVEDEARAPHVMYGFQPAREAYSAGQFMKDVSEALKSAAARGQTPIIVGGTGLYFKVLLEGLSPIPEIDPEIRAHWRGMADQHGAAQLWQMLEERDPEMAARLEPNDTQRIVRAHEVLAQTGRSLAEWQRLPGVPILQEAETERHVMKLPREELHRRADARFLRMVEMGAMDEVRALGDLKLDPSLPAMRALGVKPLLAYVRGEVTKQAAIAEGQAETRQYIKRQQTWLNRYMIAWNEYITQ